MTGSRLQAQSGLAVGVALCTLLIPAWMTELKTVTRQPLCLFPPPSPICRPAHCVHIPVAGLRVEGPCTNKSIFSRTPPYIYDPHTHTHLVNGGPPTHPRSHVVSAFATTTAPIPTPAHTPLLKPPTRYPLHNTPLYNSGAALGEAALTPAASSRPAVSPIAFRRFPPFPPPGVPTCCAAPASDQVAERLGQDTAPGAQAMARGKKTN